ncbi:MAG TPA: hypothetical protein VE173_05645, partial [Longimicrobiales bacterium]|nr:hypothetical protein [Longimicrobiales bacterium]
MKIVEELPPRLPLSEYEAVAHLSSAAEGLRAAAESVVPLLERRKVWMVSSTEQGGGVAEMLPTMLVLLRELGVDARWAVIESEESGFFDLTKALHNLIHGTGDPSVLDDGARTLYERVCRENADVLVEALEPGDILVVHDPQPLPLAGILAGRVELRTIWRCHIGLDESNEATEAAWAFLEPYAGDYVQGIFSAAEYVPRSFRSRSTVLYPAIDPLSPKNRDLSLHRTVGILSNS